MRIALYARVSTASGKQDADNQLLQLRQWAQGFGGTVVCEFVDEASGATASRQALQNMLEAAHRREFDVLLIWALDRLGRGGIAQVAAIMSKLKAANTRVLSHQESWLDTDGPVSDLLQAIFAWVAQMERDRMRERVVAGLERAQKQGKKLGRPRARIDAQCALQLQQEGLSVRAIASKLGVSKSTVHSTLSVKPH